MSKYHTHALDGADIFTIMGSVYAEVSRYDSAISSDQYEMAEQAITRANELINYSQTSDCINRAQKLEVKRFGLLLEHIAKTRRRSNLDSYLMPFAVAQRRRQFS